MNAFHLRNINTIPELYILNKYDSDYCFNCGIILNQIDIVENRKLRY